MLANGFTAELLVELIYAGLTSAQPERIVERPKDCRCLRMDHRSRTASARKHVQVTLILKRVSKPPFPGA
jgi:hypothetical protein